MIFQNEKQYAAFLSICSNAALILTKVVAGIISGSISIISEAMHSFSDVLASIIAFISVKISAEPADKLHPFGHGKFEEMSGLIEGGFICVIAIYILYTATDKIMTNSSTQIDTTIGIYVMIFSIVLNAIISRYLFHVGKKYDSIAITADAHHLSTDIWSSVAVLAGLIMINITHIILIDSIIAILVGAFIFKTGLGLMIEAGRNLLDESLPEKDLQLLNDALSKYIGNEIEAVKLSKTRKSGGEKLIELIIIVKENITIKDGHNICNKIEQEITNIMPNSEVFIHLEPAETVAIKQENMDNNSHAR